MSGGKLGKFIESWGADRILRRVLRNSSYLLAANIISAILSILTANLLGVAVFGILGIIIGFVTNVNQLFSFRMGDVIVKYLGEALEHGDRDRAGAVVKASFLIEAVTSVAAFAILALVAPFWSTWFAKAPSTAPLFVLYGVSILAHLIKETSTGILQVGNHYRGQALITLAQSLLVAAMLAWAAFSNTGLMGVLWAYLAGKVLLGIGPAALAFYWLPRMVGPNWFKAPMRALPPWGELLRFGVNTNLIGTINLVARDSELQWVGYFFGPLAAGYFKTAMAVVNLVVMPINPFIGTTYPEITRAVAAKQWRLLRRLLRRVTLIAGGWTAAVAAGLLLLGKPVLFQAWNVLGRTVQVYSAEFLPAYPVLLVLLIGFGAANILYWNRPLLLAQGDSSTPLWASFWAMLGKVAAQFLLLPWAGFIAEAWLLTGYFLVSVFWITSVGFEKLHAGEKRYPEAAA